MHRRTRPLALFLALGLAPSCRTDAPVRPGDPAVAEPTVKGVEAETATPKRRRPGVAHSGAIDKIVLAADGTSAITSDLAGGVRLWPALDGTFEPIALPIRSPQSMSLARADGGWTAFLVDASGGASVLAIGDDAQNQNRNQNHSPTQIRTLAQLPPFAPLFEGHVLPGGKHIVALFRDHTIRLLDTAGKEVARLEERKFRPSTMRVSADGRRIVAVISTPDASGATKLELQPLAVVTEGTPALRRDGPPKLATSTVAVGPSTLTLAPDGSRAAVVQRSNGTRWEIGIVEFGEGKADHQVAVTAAAHTVPGVGFVSATRLLASANDGSVSWLLELGDDSQYPRSAPPQDFSTQLRVQAFAADHHVAAHGNWLYVAKVSTRAHHFLGYRSLQANSLAISPNGTSIATVYPQGPVWVEPLSGAGEAPRELPTDPFSGVLRVRFVDDDHLLTIDGMGGVRMLDWRSGKLVAETGVNGSVRSIQVDPTGTMLLVDRQSTFNDSRLFEIRDHRFHGPYIVADTAYRTGLLGAGPGAHQDAVLWTLDSANRLRFYTMAELRSDLSDEAVKRKAIDLATGQVAPLTLDRTGRQYGVRWNENRMEIFIDDGKQVRSRPVGEGSVNEIHPSADGERFLAVIQRAAAMMVAVFDSGDLAERWTMSSGPFHSDLVWSPDGAYVGIAAQTGAVVRHAESGDIAYQRCGLDFQVTGTAPNTALSSVNQRTICEP